jgi:hypothetical protein
MSFLTVLPARWPAVNVMGVGDDGPVDRVGDVAFQRPDCFFGVLALGASAVVVLASGARVAQLGDGGDVDGVVQLAVASRVETVPSMFTGGRSIGAVAL